MLSTAPDNLIEVEDLISRFLVDCQAGVSNLYHIHIHDENPVARQALASELAEQLKIGCVTFLNKNYDLEELNSYLFYIVNDFYKKKAKPIVKRTIEYLCPGCLFIGTENTVHLKNGILRCEVCKERTKSAEPKEAKLFETFSYHSKLGYHCQDCDRFIPHPIDAIDTVSCPYYDCYFVGPWSSLKKMHHPNIRSNPEKLILDAPNATGQSLLTSTIDVQMDAQAKLEMEEELQSKVKLLQEVIDYQKNSVPYTSSNFVAKHKMLVYQAFDNLLSMFPEDMVLYLLESSRSGGFQHKVFQEYIRLLEESLPIYYEKGKKHYKIESLLDEHLSLFDGISVFESDITDRLSIKNKTTEHYIGGRKGKISRPFYIGKLLSIVDKKTKQSLLGNVVEYTFSLIRMRDVVPGTPVVVTHLRIPPHYQMGGMVYVNRVRKKIVERARILLHKGNVDV